MIDPATILFGLGAAGLKAVKAGSAASGAEVASPGGAVAEIGSELLTVLFAHHATEDIVRMRERFAEWLKGPSPHKNQDLERAVARCGILADLFCLIEALPGGIQNAGNKAWLHSVNERLPERLQKSETRGFFADIEKAQIRAAKALCEERLKAIEEEFEPSEIEPSILLKTDIDESFSEKLGRGAADAIEGQETSSGDKIGALPERVREIFTRRWFSYLTHAFRHELKSDGPVYRIYVTMRLESGFEAVETAIRDEGQKTRDHIDRALGQLPQAKPFLSNIPSRLNRPFLGRDQDLADIGIALSRPNECVLVLHGQPGTGKSELAREFARRNHDRYPGGTFLLQAATIEIDFAEIGKNILGLQFQPDLALKEQGLQTFYSLGRKPVLLIYDNVTSAQAVSEWLPRANTLCHLLFTTFLDHWDSAFSLQEVEPLSIENSQCLVDALAGAAANSAAAQRLAGFSGGLPIEICPMAASLARYYQRGRIEDVELFLVPEAKGSFEAPYGLLSTGGRLLLHAASSLASQAIPREELFLHVTHGIEWGESELNQALDDCLDLHLLEGSTTFTMHQLLAHYLKDVEHRFEDITLLQQTSENQWKRLTNLALTVASDPADADSANLLMLYPLSPQQWPLSNTFVSTADGEVVGKALYEIGRFEQAQPWFERTVDENDQSDHERLGGSLHQVGYCLLSRGLIREAQPWFERAVNEKKQGDERGRINHDGVGRSMSQVGYCLWSHAMYVEAQAWFELAVEENEQGDADGNVHHSSLGATLFMVGTCLIDRGLFEQAQPWFERAATEHGNGDIFGRVDHKRVGSSLHQVGLCLMRLERFVEAEPWLQRATCEKEEGDTHGRVDHASLGGSWHVLADCLAALGRFEEAHALLRVAIEEKERGDIYGRVDHSDLGASLHLIGDDLLRRGIFREAQSWYERAARQSELGNIHGRVNRDGLGTSLYMVGDCLLMRGEFGEAQPWFERAAEQTELGDEHGRVNHLNVSSSLRRVGYCLASQGLFGEAQPWLKRAMREAEQGDLEGRVDHAFIGEIIYYIGGCLTSQARYAEALPWFEGAAKQLEQGDVHGRVNYIHLINALRAVGGSLRQVGKPAEAQRWLRRALDLESRKQRAETS